MPQPHLLVVDPNPSTVQRVRSALAGSTYNILTARDAVEAESQASGRDIAVVLSSTGLPRGNGYDLARTLLAHQPSTKVFLLSGGFEVYNRDRAEQAGVTGRISKPFSVDGLRARLEQILGPLRALQEDTLPEMELPSLRDAPLEPLPPEPLEPTPTDRLHSRITSSLHGYLPPLAEERIATIIPRDYQQLPATAASVEDLSPALERAVMEVLPEVVETVLRHSLQASPAFRDLVEVAVDEAVRARLPEIARRVVQERLAEIEAQEPDEVL